MKLKINKKKILLTANLVQMELMSFQLGWSFHCAFLSWRSLITASRDTMEKELKLSG